MQLSSLVFFPAVFATVLGQSMDPIVKITETTPLSDGPKVKGFLAQDVLLNCFVENRPINMQVRWQRTMFDKTGRGTTNQISNDLAVEDNMKWSIEKPTASSWRLRIKSLRLSDEGNYTCYVHLTANQDRKEANRTVYVYDKPVILDQLSSNDMTVDEGDDFILRCNASGRPTPTLIWRRQGNAILPGGGVTHIGGELPVEDIQYDARGMYICEALNEVGFDRREIELNIRFSPKVASQSDSIAQAIGYQRTLVCYVEANPSPSHNPDDGEMYFSKNSQRILDDDRRDIRILEGAYGRLTFELVIREVVSGDYGLYTCTAKNNIGEGSAQITLEESTEPVIDKGGRISSSSKMISNLYTAVFLLVFLVKCL